MQPTEQVAQTGYEAHVPYFDADNTALEEELDETRSISKRGASQYYLLHFGMPGSRKMGNSINNHGGQPNNEEKRNQNDPGFWAKIFNRF